ncbi:hypothetical protein DPMN_132663 [Dreissena polymorpha]|uniref:DUF6729 domain-containing protein n=1 Tax=Dreissena polymorpha TaxID=45954 RepID=A0A9D4JDA8_DREPO|nr:hypothetical protein DPMN_132663 [Dreissena polymorpha]
MGTGFLTWKYHPQPKIAARKIVHGLFNPFQQHKTTDGSLVERKTFKEVIMWFNPPPIPTTMMGSIPHMNSFFTTPVFFWRPVGVMHAKIRCPNKNCPAPPDAFLSRSGNSSTAHQVCSEHHYYTLLTERLLCSHCKALRLRQKTAKQQVSDEEEEPQYIWQGFRPVILQSLSPAVKNMFLAIICGKRAIDKSVVTLLDDRLNAISMTKVLRLLKRQHDKWYTDIRDLNQTFLFEAYTAKATSQSGQSGILQFVNPAGSYTPPIAQPLLPDERVFRRAHLIQAMERMQDYRADILSTTGEILCIDGSKQVNT